MLKLRHAVTLAVLSLGGCAIVLTDVTPPMVYNEPDNIQTIAVRATPRGSSSPIGSVEVTIDGGAARPMASDPLPGDSNRYSVRLPFAPCQEVVEYVFVARESGSGIRGGARAPRAGVFRQAITDTAASPRPVMCQSDMVAQREAYVVNNIFDAVDANRGDGVCDTRAIVGRPVCTLRAAVMEANASPGADVILVSQDAERPEARRYTLTISGDDGASPDASRGDLDITEAVTIRGVWPDDASIVRALRYRAGFPASVNFMDEPTADSIITKIDAGRIDRIFDIHTSPADTAPVVRIENMILLNGLANTGGAIHNKGRLAVSRVGFVSNLAFGLASGGAVPAGGAIYNFGAASLDLVDTAFFWNATQSELGALAEMRGGALLNESASTTTVNRAVFALNRANTGSAIMNSGRIEIRATSIVENSHVDTRARAAAFDNLGVASVSFASFDVNNLRAIRTGAAGAGSLQIDSSLVTGFGEDLTCDGGAARSLGGNRFSSLNCPRLSLTDTDRETVFTTIADRALMDVGGLLPVWSVGRTDRNVIDSIDPSSSLTCNAANDQRSVPRPQDGNGDGVAWCDAGAFERRPTD